MNDLPEDIRLWLLTANPETGMLGKHAPLPVAHDAANRGLVRNESGSWILTAEGRAARNKLLSD